MAYKSRNRPSPLSSILIFDAAWMELLFRLLLWRFICADPEANTHTKIKNIQVVEISPVRERERKYQEKKKTLKPFSIDSYYCQMRGFKYENKDFSRWKIKENDYCVKSWWSFQYQRQFKRENRFIGITSVPLIHRFRCFNVTIFVSFFTSISRNKQSDLQLSTKKGDWWRRWVV